MNTKNTLFNNKLWQNIDPKSDFITEICFFNENGSPYCRYDHKDETKKMYCGHDVINDVLRIDLGEFGHYKVIIDKNNLKLIRTKSFFKDHEMHVFTSGIQ